VSIERHCRKRTSVGPRGAAVRPDSRSSRPTFAPTITVIARSAPLADCSARKTPGCYLALVSKRAGSRREFLHAAGNRRIVAGNRRCAAVGSRVASYSRLFAGKQSVAPNLDPARRQIWTNSPSYGDFAFVLFAQRARQSVCCPLPCRPTDEAVPYRPSPSARRPFPHSSADRPALCIGTSRPRLAEPGPLRPPVLPQRSKVVEPGSQSDGVQVPGHVPGVHMPGVHAPGVHMPLTVGIFGGNPAILWKAEQSRLNHRHPHRPQFPPSN
jgi:hypothetical protein